MTLPPCNCTICYQMYNNERSPLILTKCGHTFCKECLDIIMNHTLKHIACPECKQITEITDNPGKSLPKNRGLLNLIIYNESISKVIIKKDELVKKVNPENEKIITDYENSIYKIEDTYKKIIEDHSYLNDISEVLLRKEVDESLDFLIGIINEYRENLYKKIKNEFEKINLIKSFKGSIEKYKNKLTDFHLKSIVTKTSLNTSCIDESHSRSPLYTSMVTQAEEDNILEQVNYNLSQKEFSDLKGEIEFIELYNLTLKNYSKDIYNPCKFFFVNKFQSDKLSEEIKKILIKVCDFDESISSFNINKININNDKSILKEINDACYQSNYRKLTCIFNHFKLNPNFILSDQVDNSSHSTNIVDLPQLPLANQTFTSNFNAQLHLNVPGNQRNNTSNNILRNVTGNNSSRVTNNNPLSLKDKVINFHSYLKQFKDKPELIKITKYLIDEFNYVPLKLENDSTKIEVSLVKDIEWKLPISII